MVVVVDNDPGGPAADVVRSVQEENPVLPIRYVIEPDHGISYARNRGVAEARDHDLIAFIDDDAIAHPSWLRELLRTYALYGGQIVAGPVVPAYESPVPGWVLKGSFFDRPRRPTGSRVKFAGTGNMMIERLAIERAGIVFDEELAETGGSDTLFCMEARLAGLSLVWADEAVVTEWMPPSRTTVGWIVRRGYRLGSTIARCEAKVKASGATRVLRVLKGVFRLIQGTGFLLAGILTMNKSRMVRGLRDAARGWGMLTGLFGRRYYEYRPGTGD